MKAPHPRWRFLRQFDQWLAPKQLNDEWRRKYTFANGIHAAVAKYQGTRGKYGVFLQLPDGVGCSTTPVTASEVISFLQATLSQETL